MDGWSGRWDDGCFDGWDGSGSWFVDGPDRPKEGVRVRMMVRKKIKRG
jgi:hypothetical protein